MAKVSVIVPIYNVSPYIERCLHSLFKQTLQDLEFIFVNDATPDNSMEILQRVLKKYPGRIAQVKLIENRINKGLASSRNVGIKEATGKYIIHCDADDYVDLTMYETLYKKAEESGGDMVMCDYYFADGKNFIKHNIPEWKEPKQYIIHWFDSQMDYSTVWNKLIKRDLILKNNIFTFDGHDDGEDLYTSIRYFYYIDNISIVNQPLYFYCRNDNSISTKKLTVETYSKRKKLIDKICEFLEDKPEYRLFCNNLKFNQKMRGLRLFADSPEKFYSLYKECHKDILKYKDNPIKSRILWKIALSGPGTYKTLSKFLKVLK